MLLLQVWESSVLSVEPTHPPSLSPSHLLPLTSLFPSLSPPPPFPTPFLSLSPSFSWAPIAVPSEREMRCRRSCRLSARLSKLPSPGFLCSGASVSNELYVNLYLTARVVMRSAVRPCATRHADSSCLSRGPDPGVRWAESVFGEPIVSFPDAPRLKSDSGGWERDYVSERGMRR